MPSENDIQLDRELMLTCLKEVAKEYHKQFKGGNIEIIIVGGASLAIRRIQRWRITICGNRY